MCIRKAAKRPGCSQLLPVPDGAVVRSVVSQVVQRRFCDIRGCDAALEVEGRAVLALGTARIAI